MLYSNSFITDGYTDFLDTCAGTGMSLNIFFENEAGESCRVSVKLKPYELEDILTEQLEPILGRNAAIDPEFADEVRMLAEEISDAILDGEPFEKKLGESCRISAEEHEHPYLTAASIRLSDGHLYRASKAYQEHNDGEYVKMGFSSGKGTFIGFACESYEAPSFFAVYCRQLQKMSDDPQIGDKIAAALHAAKTPTFTLRVDDITVSVQNTFISPRAQREMQLYDDQWLAGEEIDPYEIFDDDDIKALKASRTREDRREEMLEDLPEEDEYEEEKDAGPAMF